MHLRLPALVFDTFGSASSTTLVQKQKQPVKLLKQTFGFHVCYYLSSHLFSSEISILLACIMYASALACIHRAF